MSELRDFFEERKKEVNIYFEFISKLKIDSVSNLNIKIDSRNSYQVDDDLKKILKSNAILILYNFIEGIVSKSIECILDSINDKNVKYSELKDGLKHIMLKSTKSINKKDFQDRNKKLVEFIDNIFDEIFNLEYTDENKKIILQGGGNIDAKFIRENIAQNLHIDFTKREDKLLIVKNDRNHLAHGSKSFIECSQDKTLREIKDYKTKIFKYLDSYIKAVDKYIDEKRYKI